MNVTYFGKFHPQWLHFKLTENKEYRMRFADRVYRHFFNDGSFIPDSCISRFKKTADQLDLAIIAESARWGDSKSGTARTKDDHWIPAVNRVVFDYMPYRTEIVLQQLFAENLYISLKPPVFKNNGVEITASKITIAENYNLTLSNPNTNGSIFYTVNGTDPRAVGGVNSGTAISAGNSAVIVAAPGTIIKARVKYTETWSALHEIVFEDSGLFSNLKVTELHYHPATQGNVDHKELEFIELKNIGKKTLDLSGLAFTDGIQFTFPAETTLSPNSFMIVASNGIEFEKLYGFAPHFVYSGSLSNGGEKIVLQTSSNQIIFSFTYDDELPWPVEADGNGYSLVSKQVNPTGNPDSVNYWTISKYENGSPMTDDLMSVTGIEEITAANKFDFQLYPNPTTSAFYIDFELKTSGKVEILLYDLNGRLVESLLNEHLAQGFYSRYIQPSRLQNSGIFVVALKKQNEVVTKKLVVQK